jgi:hypothetical protein
MLENMTGFSPCYSASCNKTEPSRNPVKPVPFKRTLLYLRPNRNTNPVLNPKFFTCNVLLKLVSQYPG